MLPHFCAGAAWNSWYWTQAKSQSLVLQRERTVCRSEKCICLTVLCCSTGNQTTMLWRHQATQLGGPTCSVASRNRSLSQSLHIECSVVPCMRVLPEAARSFKLEPVCFQRQHASTLPDTSASSQSTPRNLTSTSGSTRSICSMSFANLILETAKKRRSIEESEVRCEVRCGLQLSQRIPNSQSNSCLCCCGAASRRTPR